jgi:23S rRNA (uracil1939-C5)-methyltransferase
MQVAYFDSMKQDDVLTLTIRDMGYAGEGIAQCREYTVFVPFALPEEVVEVKVDHVKKNLVYAHLLRVLEPSPHRVQPPCNRYMKCGGCDLMHVDYAYQLARKREQVATTLGKAGVHIKVQETVPSPKTLGYRNKMMLPFGIVEGKVALGFYREGTHRIVRLTKCPLHEAWAEKVIGAVLAFAEEHKLSVYDSESGKGLLRHLVVRKLSEHLDITLVVNAVDLPHASALVDKLKDVWHDFTLYVSPNLRHNNVVMGDKVCLKWGESYVHETLGVRYEVNPLSFVQVNDEVCAAIYGRVSDFIIPSLGKTIVDAFAGVGVLGASFAKAGASVYNIEIVPEATADADALAKANGIVEHNLCADSAVALPSVLKDIEKDAPKVHYMHLLAPYFNAIKEGRKVYELRLNDDKRRLVRVGDLICFDANGQQLYCRVTELKAYVSFDALFEDLGTVCTMGEKVSKDEATRCMDGIYGEKDRQRFGALAIGVVPVNVHGVYVVLDPPRKGCPSAVIEALTSLGRARQDAHAAVELVGRETVTLPYIEQIVYISCNPATLARDLAALAETYHVEEVTPFDMFPQTRHIETLVRLSGIVRQKD